MRKSPIVFIVFAVFIAEMGIQILTGMSPIVWLEGVFNVGQ